jgi:hypothetical protein
MHAIIHVFTYKAGLLARLAHDLRLTVEQHQLTLQGRQLRGHCTADSLRIDGVPGSKGLDTQTLSTSDKQQISETIRNEILQADRHPRIEFEGEITGSGKLQVRGTLRLRGQSRSIAVDVTRSADRLHCSFELTPTQFGIAPYKALAGAIKLQDRVGITIDVLLEGQNPDTLLAGTAPVQLDAATGD